MRLIQLFLSVLAFPVSSVAFSLQSAGPGRSPTTKALHASSSGAGNGVSLVAKAAVKSTGVGKRVGVAGSPAAVAAASVNDVVAKVVGYLLGAGSMLVYMPIIVGLVKDKNADGMSVMTWVYNLLGMSIGLVYPFKKAFPLSTYIEILILTVQSAGILGLVCHYRELTKEYLLGMGVFALLAGTVTVAQVNAKALQALQLLAIVICNYANIPQILLTFRAKKASWSPITAGMSMAGNLIRIFTTMQLTQDLLVMSGNLLGLITNAVLLLQIWLYRDAK